METGKLKTIAAVTGALILAISLTQHSYCTADCGSSLTAFLLGWMGIMMEAGEVMNAIMAKVEGKSVTIEHELGATFTWLANPLLIASFVVVRRNAKTAAVFSGLATALIFSFLLFNTVIDNEAGHYNTIKNYGLGYWLWLASSVFMLCASLYFWKSEGRTK